MPTGLFPRLTGRLVAAALIAAPLLVSGAPALAVAPAAPGELSPDSTTVAGQPLLEWTRVTGAAEYDVEISTQSDFATTVYDETTENSRATPTQALPSGDLFWRVRGVTSSEARGAWGTAMFSHDVVAGPTLSAPENGAQLQQPDDPALLTWLPLPVTGATSYTIEVDNDDLFVDADSYTSKTTAFTISDPGPQQTYYWHVRANLSGGITSDWSDTRNFDVLALAAPVLTGPDDSATTQVRDVVLDWEPVPGAVKYELRVSPDDQFTDADTKTVVSTRYSPPTTFNNDQYWWQVRAIDVNGNKSPWATSANQFQRNWPNRPQLNVPADGSTVTDHVYYEWDPVYLASSYQLDVGTDSSFSPSTFDSCDTHATTFTTGRVGMKACTPLSDGIYYWRVQALDGPASPNVNGIFSEIHSFVFDAPDVNQLSPPFDPFDPGTIPTVEVPSLSWEAYPDTEKYVVEVMKANGSTIKQTTTYSTSWTPTGSTRLNPADGPFRWTVQAIGANDSETPVPLEEFQSKFNLSGIVTDDGGVPALTPTSPNGSHSYRAPALTWEPYVDTLPAAYYQVYVAPVGSSTYVALGGASPDHFPYPSATDDSTTLLFAGNYHWFANAYTTQGALLASGLTKQGTFTIDSLPTPAGTRLSLTGQGLQAPSSTCERLLSAPPTVCGNLQQTPVLAWDPVPEAGFYMVYLSRDRELTNLTSLSNTHTVSTMWNPTELLPDSQAGTAYYWVIRACKAEGVCEPEPTDATNAFDKRSNAVSGLTEIEHESDVVLPPSGPGGPSDLPEFADEIVLSWDDYLATSQAGNGNDVTGLPSTVEAMSYEVEMGSNPNFPSTDTIKSGRIDQTTFTPYVQTLPEGPFYWRVRAVDGQGNALPWSVARSTGGGSEAIEKRSPTTTLVSPTGGAVVSQTPAFTWDALAYAAKYDIQISKSGDTTFSSPVVNTSTTQTSYVPTSTLDPAGSPYVWRIRRKDFNNRAGEWTAPQSFSVAAAAPEQVSPPADVFVSATDSLFTWMPSAGAASYRFERRTLGSTSSQETKSTVGLSWAPTSTLPDAKYEWRVSSYDAGNKLLASSPWSPFVVDATAPTVIHKLPTGFATPTTNFKVDFSEKVTGVSSATFAIYLAGNPHKLSAAVKLTDHNKTATLNPAGKLKVGKSYTIKLLKGIKDVAGHALKPTSWTVLIRAG